MFQYVHTTGDIIQRGPDKQLLRPYVKNYLYSLYNGFSQQYFGYDTMDKLADKIKIFYDNLYEDEKLFIDSGGYSIIAGDISPRDIIKFIEVYNHFLGNYSDRYHYLMSLDIPIFLKYPQYNNTKYIYEFNLISSHKSKELLDKNPKLYDNFLFVWHFKLHKQFDIWRTVYNQTFRQNNLVKNFAIGGLVSLRGITGIKFSPFIGPAYKILKEIYDKNLNFTSIIHILGVYGKHDRLAMMFMDKLFNNYYLKEKQSKINITFDTVNYTISGLYKIRESPFTQIPLIDEIGNNIITTNGTIDYCNKLIPDLQVKNMVIMELKNIEEGKPVNNPKLLSLTYVIYSYMLDWTMNKFIEEENIYDLFLNHGNNWNKLKALLTPICDKAEIKYPFAFKNLSNNILSNFHWLSNFHKAWENGAKDDMDRLDNGVKKFSEAIGFPFDLEGDFTYKVK